jgi:hypothetical protein
MRTGGAMFKNDRRFSAVLGLVLFLLPGVGTMLHELSHVTVARFLGYDATISYGGFAFRERPKGAGTSPEPRAFLEESSPVFRRDWLLIAAAGPAQTMATSLLGLAWIARRRGLAKRGPPYTGVDWLAIALVLFAVRAPIVFVEEVVVDFGRISSLAESIGDEEWLNAAGGLPNHTVSASLAVMAIVIIFPVAQAIHGRLGAGRFLLAMTICCVPGALAYGVIGSLFG